MKLYEGMIDDPIYMFEKMCVLAQIEVSEIQRKSESKSKSKPEFEDKQNDWNQSRQEKKDSSSPKRRRKG